MQHPRTLTVTTDELILITQALEEYAETLVAADEAGVDPQVDWEARAAEVRALSDRLYES